MRTLCLSVALALLVLCSGARAADQLQPTQDETLDLLKREQFTELDRRYGAIQQAYKQRSISDEDLRAAFRTFYATDPALEPLYAAWVRHSPNSYVAHLARGIYFKKVGAERRGDAFIDQTSAAQIQGMESANEIAAKEFRASERLDDQPLLTYMHFMDLYMDAGDKVGGRRLLNRAIAFDPHNLVVREKYMGLLQTRWAGSLAEMKAFLAQCRQAGLSASQLNSLKALVLEEEGWVHQHGDGDMKAAARAYAKAAALDPESSCQPCGPLSQAGEASLAAGDYKAAINFYSKVLVANPKEFGALSHRAYAQMHLGHPQEALKDAQQAAQQGDLYSEYLLGRMNLFGIALPQDRDKAIEWLQRAANAGFQPAIELLPVAMDRSHTPMLPPDGPRF